TREDDGTLPALRVRWGIEPHDAPDAKSRLADLVGRRLMLMPLVAEAKRREGLPIEDPEREAKVVDAWVAAARSAGLDEASVAVFARAQVEAAKSVQQAVLSAQPRSARRGASGAAEANAPDAGGDDGIGLSELRTAISRIDGEIECEIARSAPVGASSVEIAAAIRESAPVPGLDHADVARIAVALAAIPAASRPAPTAAAPAAGPSVAPAATPDSGVR
ncbi:MAG: chorismate mutase, partial [Alphaproteobacteria bacterium]